MGIGQDWEIYDERFRMMVPGNAWLEKLHGGMRWAEGPVYFADGDYLVWSDIPNNVMLQYVPGVGVRVFRHPAGHSNGNTRDREGRLITCEHGGRRVSRTEHDGHITTLADNYQGKKLNSPNDVVVKSDGTIWFTDPPYGILGFYEGEVATPELPTNIYRVDGQTGAIQVITGDVNRPNGLAFSPDERILYVVEAGATPNRVIRAFDVSGEGAQTRIANSRTFYACREGETPDGFRVDVDGNLWCGWGMGTAELDGVRILNSSGAPIGHIRLPERCANLAFGGRHRNRLFMPASKSLYSIFVNTQGMAGG